MRVSSSFSFFANSLMSSMYIRWLIFSCDLLSLYPAVHFLSMWLSGIMAIMNSKGDSVSPWKIPLWVFISAKLLPPAVSSTLQVCMVFSVKFMTSCDILYIIFVEPLLLLLLFYPFESFSHQHQLMVFQWSVSYSKSPQVSWTFLSILADLNSAFVWIVSTRVLTSSSSSPITNPFVAVPSAPIIIGITVTFMFHGVFFFQFLSKV